MSEKPKRLTPKRKTLQELYIKSGNQCAYPDCTKVLINSEGDFVGQLCHIEAAETLGPRFNKNQTNEQRRHVSNLLLMCYEHHIQTNNVSEYPIEKMRSIKKEHEKKFSDVVGTMLLSITDHTTVIKLIPTKNLLKFDRILKWDSVHKELKESVDELNEMAIELAKIPKPSRELFLVLVNRSKKEQFGSKLEVSIPEVQQATGLNDRELQNCLSILDNYNFIFDNGKDDSNVQMIGISSLKSKWNAWEDLKEFCKKNSTDISRLIINLDYSMLDE